MNDMLLVFDQDNLPSSTIIWRYMEFWKFEDMIKTKSLFFTKLSKLPDYDEGTIPKYDLLIEEQVKQYLIKEYGGFENYKIITGNPLPERQMNLKKLKDNSIVNCWHISSSESKEMWKLDKGKNVVIKSTIGNLKDSIDESRFPITLCKVDYIDFSKQGIGKEWIFNKHLSTKQQKFQHENEIRLLISSNHTYSNQKEDHDFGIYGIKIHANLDKLIDKIYVSPNNEILLKTRNLIQKYLPDKHIIRSTITD